MTTATAATSGFTFPTITAPTWDVENTEGKYTLSSKIVPAETTTIYFSLFGTDLLTSAVETSVIDVAKASQWTACDDVDSCLFFFDGYVFNITLEATDKVWPGTAASLDICVQMVNWRAWEEVKDYF